MSMSAHHHPGTPGSCSDPRPLPPGPLPPDEVSPSQGGGLRELAKRAALRDVHVSVNLMDEFLRFGLFISLPFTSLPLGLFIRACLIDLLLLSNAIRQLYNLTVLL